MARGDKAITLHIYLNFLSTSPLFSAQEEAVNNDSSPTLKSHLRFYEVQLSLPHIICLHDVEHRAMLPASALGS